MAFQFCFFHYKLSWLFWPLLFFFFLINIRVNLLISLVRLKNEQENLLGYIQSVAQFGENWHLSSTECSVPESGISFHLFGSYLPFLNSIFEVLNKSYPTNYFMFLCSCKWYWFQYLLFLLPCRIAIDFFVCWPCTL